jgi:hypothetical protein
MLRLLLSPVRRKSSRPLHEIYPVAIDSSLWGVNGTGTSKLLPFLAATTWKSVAQRKPEAFADTEWLCTQWPDHADTDFAPTVM